MQHPDMNAFLQYYIDVLLQQQRDFQNILTDMDSFCEKKTQDFDSVQFFGISEVGLVQETPIKAETEHTTNVRTASSTEQDEQPDETFEGFTPRKKQKTPIPKSSIAILKSWLFSHYVRF